MKSHSISSRFAITFIANIIKAITSFSVGIILAKSMGSELFGIYSFLLASFIASISLFDLGASSAFYTFISKGKRSNRFFKYYLSLICSQYVFFLLLLFVFVPDSIINRFLFTNEKIIILASFTAVFFQYHLWNAFTQVAESLRETFYVQKINVFISVVMMVTVYALASIGKVSPMFVFAATIIIYVIAFIFLAIFLKRNKDLFLDRELPYNVNQFKNEFLTYCKPLIIFSIFNFLYQFLDAWFLQEFNGVEQQAFFSVASKIAAISILFSASLSKVIWKEIAEAEEKNDKAKVKKLFANATKMIYLASLCIAAYLMPWSDVIITKLLGADYYEAIIPFSIMLFFPIHQSLGQLVGVMFYAMSETKTYMKLGISGMIVSIIVSYGLISSGFFPSGSIALSLKMVLVQIVMVNIGLWLISRIQETEYSFWYQIYSLVVMVAFSFGLQKTVVAMFDNLFYQGLSFSIIYSIFIFAFCTFYMKIEVGMNVLSIINNKVQRFRG
ncbi:oligosaccharide flippase family protein [Vibrio tapetis subsp. quintayensis]|uniref:lipopolysaccharide biosynthesis protein n=1 Tax=Vibrio tapetis TaxID=52443 RepID=UPI0025B5A375|nr:oligosaccharide flippase family protein [Vibrio tapetis]MDN3679443.1 oligosaccharide flippase family protein [Vibrio tapetis subsp. quintayensis]